MAEYRIGRHDGRLQKELAPPRGDQLTEEARQLAEHSEPEREVGFVRFPRGGSPGRIITRYFMRGKTSLTAKLKQTNLH